jgi:hypothetical protein
VERGLSGAFFVLVHLFGEAENSIRIYREAPVATPALH